MGDRVGLGGVGGGLSLLQGQCGRSVQRRNPPVSALSRGVVGLRFPCSFIYFKAGIALWGKGPRTGETYFVVQPPRLPRALFAIVGLGRGLPSPPAPRGQRPPSPPSGLDGGEYQLHSHRPGTRMALGHGCSPPLFAGRRQLLPTGLVALPAAFPRLVRVGRRAGPGPS